MQEQYKQSKYYTFAKGGRLNLFQFFYPLGIDIAKYNGIICMITQNSILAEDSALGNRRLFFDDCTILQMDSFPERDNKKKRVFESVKMSVCIGLLRKHQCTNTEFRINVWYDKYMQEKHYLDITYSEIKALYPESYTIPLCNREKLYILLKMNSYFTIPLIAKSGEIDMTKYKPHFSPSKTNRVITGAQVQKFHITDTPQQGGINYLNDEDCLFSQNRRNEIISHTKACNAKNNRCRFKDKTNSYIIANRLSVR